MMTFDLLNVTIISLLVNGLVLLDLSNIGQCLETISFISGLSLLYVVINIKGVSFFLISGRSIVNPFRCLRKIPSLLL